MKTPEEIKKGLECCGNDMFLCPDECPYIGSAGVGSSCAVNMLKDALAYIQQLEANDSQVKKALQDNGFGSLEEFLQAFSQVKAERDAAVEDIRRGSRCSACKMFFHNGGRCSGGIYCVPMDFEWRGVQEQPKQEDRNDV